MLDLLLSEDQPLLGYLTKSCSWQSVCIEAIFWGGFSGLIVVMNEQAHLIFNTNAAKFDCKCVDRIWKYVLRISKKNTLYALRNFLTAFCPLLEFCPFVCKYPCSHETETNRWPRAKDMAMSLVRQKWRAFLAPVSTFHLLHPVEVKMDGPLAPEHHIQPLCWHIVSSFCPSLALWRSVCPKLVSNQWQLFLKILFGTALLCLQTPIKPLLFT